MPIDTLPPSTEHDALVIGGSFAGLSAAMYIARGRRRVAVVDSGQPRNRFAAHSHGFFAHDGDPPLSLIAAGRERLLAYPEVSWVPGRAEQARREGPEAFSVTLADGQVLRARRLLLAFGLADELPAVPGAKERWGEGVLHCPYCHGHEFSGQPLGVLAVMPQSVHQAQLIAEWGPTTLFLDGHEDWLDAEQRADLKTRGVTIEPAPVQALTGPAPALDGVQLADGRHVPLRALYLAPRTRMASPLAEQLGCAFDDGPFGPVLRVDEFRMTSVPGVFAAGDITQAMHSATFASAGGVMAGVSLHRTLVFGLG